MGFKRRLPIYLACAAQFLVLLDFSATNVFAAHILRDLQLGENSGFWMMIAFALPYGAFLLLGGRMSDWLGAGRIMCAGLALAVIGGILCAIAQGPYTFLMARALQGLAAALVSPASLTAVLRFGKDEQERSLSIYGAVSSLGFSVGLMAGGLIGEFSGWRWFFAISGVLAAFALAPMMSMREKEPFQIPPLVSILPLAMASLLTAFVIIGLSLLAESGNSPVLAWGLLLSGIAGLAFLCIRAQGEFIAVRQMLSRLNASLPIAAAGLIGAALAPMLLMVSLYQGTLMGLGVFAIALRFLPHGIACAIVGSRLPGLIERFGPNAIAQGSLLLLAAGLLSFWMITPQVPYVLGLLPGLLLTAAGIVGGFVSLTVLANSAVTENEQGLVSALINMSDQIGCALGLAVSALVVTRMGNGTEAFPTCLALLSLFPLAGVALTLWHKRQNTSVETAA